MSMCGVCDWSIDIIRDWAVLLRDRPCDIDTVHVDELEWFRLLLVPYNIKGNVYTVGIPLPEQTT